MGSGMDSKADNVAQIWLYKNTPLQTTLPATLQSGARPFTPVRSLLYYACEYHVNTHTHTHTVCVVIDIFHNPKERVAMDTIQ